MAYLRTLEGTNDTAGVDINDLFDVNDVLGCLLFGRDAWNMIKAYACNRALELLANKNDFYANLRKIAGKKVYYTKNDILDKVFGFNHTLGCELYGADEWGEFVRDCKSFNAPELNGFWDGVKALANPKGILYPENFSPAGLAQWGLAAGLTNIADATYKFGSPSSTQKNLTQQTETYKQIASDAQKHEQEVNQAAAERVEAARNDYNIAYADARAKSDADAAANKQLQYELKTNPDYMANQRNNVILICGAALLGLAIWKGGN